MNAIDTATVVTITPISLPPQGQMMAAKPAQPYVETMQALAAHWAAFVGPRKPQAASFDLHRKEWVWNDISDIDKSGYWYPFDKWVAYDRERPPY